MGEGLRRWLEQIAEEAEEDFEMRNRLRDQALQQSRMLIRHCSRAIRAGHRNEWEAAEALLTQANATGRQLQEMLASYPDLYHAGYTQDAFKEWVEARLTLALLGGRPLPFPEELGVPHATFLNGLCEAASELRRRCLDLMRRGEMAEAEQLLDVMDAVYEALMAFGYPDVVTGGLRRRVDQLRGVLERTRGDLTNSLQMHQLAEALAALDV
ncbi:MAG: haloacid dehalogenase [Anaerolineae bacterium]